jgi:hypothetical protein
MNSVLKLNSLNWALFTVRYAAEAIGILVLEFDMIFRVQRIAPKALSMTLYF